MTWGREPTDILSEQSEYYPVNAATANGRYVYTLFSSIDEIWHGNLRKSINWIFTPRAAASYEPIVDNTLRIFLQEINRRFADRDGPDGVIDFSRWFLYFTFDVMGDLTYSRRYGFLESGRDVDGIISYVQNFLSYGFFVSGFFFLCLAVSDLLRYTISEDLLVRESRVLPGPEDEEEETLLEPSS